MISQTLHSKDFVCKPYNVSLMANILQMGFFLFTSLRSVTVGSGGVEGLLFSPQIVYGKGLALIKNKSKKSSRTNRKLFANFFKRGRVCQNANTILIILQFETIH